MREGGERNCPFTAHCQQCNQEPNKHTSFFFLLIELESSTTFNIIIPNLNQKLFGDAVDKMYEWKSQDN